MGRVCVSLYVLDRNEGFNLACSGFQVPSRRGHPFGSMSVPLSVLDRNEGFNLFFSGFRVPSRWDHPFWGRVSVFIRTRSDRRNFLLLAAAPLPCLTHAI